MAKIYDAKSFSKPVNEHSPKAATIQKILSFSRSLHIVNYKNMQFENNQN
jgi:hypothetical protein